MTVLCLAGTVASQSRLDERDVVTLRTGKKVRGRVLQRFGDQELLLLRGGKRLRIARRDIQALHTVNDSMREFFDHRGRAAGSLKRAWMLVSWAESRGLDNLARLLALEILLRDKDHEAARLYLGHRQHRGGWLWPVKGKHTTFRQYQNRHSKWGTALLLRGEHYELRTNAGLERAVPALFDLERLYLVWMDTFGKALTLREVLVPMHIHLWASAEEFPSVSGRKIPYYGLQQGFTYGATYFAEKKKRPVLLFTVGTQCLIDHTLGNQGASGPGQSRHPCAWAEMGLSQWMESLMQGPPGRARPGKPRIDGSTITHVLRSGPRLKRIIHLPYSLFLDLSPKVPRRWDSSRALVQFLMAEDSRPRMRGRFLHFLTLAFGKGMGDSSTAFRRAMGVEDEVLEKRFLAWLRTHQG